MINKSILNTEVQNFIRDFEGDVSKLAFAGSPFEDVTLQELIQQIESRNRIEKKLPIWYKASKILFPPKLNLEQTSSETTARYKASIIEGETIADITGGFGVDSYFFSEKFKNVYHFEINETLSELAAHNFEVFGKGNIVCTANDGLKATLSNKYDVIYADPSRRHDSKGKVFFLNDCVPDIPGNVSELLANCKTLLLKTSPMLDISVGLNELQHVAEIHIVAVENEVKELLWVLRHDAANIPDIKTINFSKAGVETFNFKWGTEAAADYSFPKKFLFEPNAAILKSGAFDNISEELQVYKLNKNTHLYTGDQLIDFPGRSFRIEKVIPYSKAEMRKETFKKANIATRNFPESVASLRKKWKIADGGAVYLFFVTTFENQKEVIICSKK